MPPSGTGKTGEGKRMANHQEPGETPELGEWLRRAREEMGRSPKEMAGELRLTEEKVRALEAEDFRNLPGEAYVRGYLRNYAAALGLSPDAVIAAYEGRGAGGSDLPEENDTPIIPEPERPLIEHPWRVVWISLALLVVVSVLTVWLVGESREPELPDQAAVESGSADSAPEPDTPPEVADEPGPAVGGPGGEGGSAGPGLAEPGSGSVPGGPGAAPTAPTGSGPALGTGGGTRVEGRNLTGPGLAEPALPDLAKTPKEPAPVRPEDLQTLRVHTWARSWLEVADSRGRQLLRRLVPEGRDLRVYGVAPFQVKVGNAAGVQLYFEDQPLPPLGRPGQVVRLNVDADSRTIPESAVGPPENLAAVRQAGEEAGSPEGRGGTSASSPSGVTPDAGDPEASGRSGAREESRPPPLEGADDEAR